MKVGRGVGGNANNNEVEMFKLLMRAEKADTRIQSLEREVKIHVLNRYFPLKHLKNILINQST